MKYSQMPGRFPVILTLYFGICGFMEMHWCTDAGIAGARVNRAVTLCFCERLWQLEVGCVFGIKHAAVLRTFFVTFFVG